MQLLVLHHHVPYFDFSYKNDILIVSFDNGAKYN